MNEAIEKLINHSVEYAQDLIEGTLEFYPFAAFIDTIGNVHPLEFELDKKKMPKVEEVINKLTSYCETQMNDKKMNAYCMVFESELVLEEGENAVKCISIDCNHISENNLPIFYQSYNISSDNDVTYSDIFAVKR